jgi:uncharacterized surface protein with fasciclin (FAS1) repeats
MRRLILGLTAAALAVAVVAAPVTAKSAKSPTIVDVAIAANASGPFAGQFDTLIAAVLAADPAVVETLSGVGRFTVFAPTDDAFAALGITPANVAAVPGLTNILLYHVARGERLAADVVSSDKLRMLNGEFAEVSLAGGNAYIDGARIVVTDITAPSNGVVHAIGGVMLP